MSDSNSMSAHCINIAISGISSKASDELKIELRQIIPNHFDIDWINIASQNIDLLLYLFSNLKGLTDAYDLREKREHFS